MNFKELYDNNRAAIESLLTAMWCGEVRDEQQQKYAEQMNTVIGNIFAPSDAVPVVQCMNLYKSVHSVSVESAKGLVGNLWKFQYPPYEHQYQCWDTLLNKKTEDGLPKSIVVTTGTGSGKTECFMMPLVHDLINCGQSGQIQALFLYPLNALMEDQKERLEKMLDGTNLTYAVYNGDLPEREPSADDHSDYACDLRRIIAQIRGEYIDADGTKRYKFSKMLYTREQIRRTPPNILLTNPTMLEYVLLRQADSSLINPSLKSLRWVAIDETHSYTGAGAAELAMLLRRVLLAFNVKAENVRFATSSATFGNASTPNEVEEEKSKLKEFISGITGLKTGQVDVIDGVRIGEEEISDNEDRELWKRICNNDYISLGDLFPEGSISEKLGQLEAMCQREDNLEKPVSSKMKVKVHYFYRVPNNGLYVKLTEQEDGCFKIYTQNSLASDDNRQPMLEITRCKHCGGFVAVAMYNHKTNAYGPLLSDEGDMFDIEEVSNDDNNVHPVMLGISKNAVEMGDGNIMLRVDGEKLVHYSEGEHNADDWFIVGNTNYRCPYCNLKVSNRKGGNPEDFEDAANDNYAKLQRFRLSQELISRYLAPSILNQLEKNSGNGDVQKLHEGQQYISFVDSRQAAAISTLKQNLEQERAWVYSTIFHELCRRKANQDQVNAKIKELKKKWAETDDDNILTEINKLKSQTKDSMTWMEIFELLKNNQYCEKLCALFVKRSTNSEETELNGGITQSMKEKYVHSVMAMYLSRRPKSAPAPETLGLFRVIYPQLNKLDLPEGVNKFNALIQDENNKITQKDWHNLLEIFLNYNVRSNQSVFFKIADNYPLDIFSLNRFATEKPRRRPVKRPRVESSRRAGLMSRLVIYLGALLSGSDDMSQIREAVFSNVDSVNRVLDDLWTALTEKTSLIEWGQILDKNANRPHFIPDRVDNDIGVEPYRLNLLKLSFKLYDKVCLCDVNGGDKVKCLRPVETVFKGFTLHPSGQVLDRVGEAIENWEVFPYYKGSGKTIGPQELAAWSQENRRFLCESGLWGENGIYKVRLDDIYLMPNLFVQAEHTAQVDKEVSRTLQSEFKNHEVNVLACSTTMEMGVDLGNLELVMLSSVPPMPANYKQRAGRSGRNNKMRSACLTLCGSDAVGLRTLYNPIERIIKRPVAVPKIDLMSEQVVSRHVNSYLIREFGVFSGEDGSGSLMQKVVDFFTPYTIQREAGNSGRWIIVDSNQHPVHPDSGMGVSTNTRYKMFVDKCNDVDAIERIREGLASLLQNTCFSSKNDIETVVNMSKDSMVRCYQELSAKVEDIKWAYNNETQDSPRFRSKLEIQYIEVLGERLINYWATHRFTPNANMPVNVIEFNLGAARETLFARQSSNPSYSLREALTQYVPGNCVVIDGIAYKVRGIEFSNMYNPVNAFKKISHNTESVKINELVPSAIPWTINEKTELVLISPTGFMPDFNDDYTRIIDDNVYTHVSAQLIGASEWILNENDDMIAVRTNKEDSGEAKILYYNEGIGYGYCFCSRCGRMVLESEPAENGDVAGNLPQEMNNKHPRRNEDENGEIIEDRPNFHLCMKGKQLGKKCIGSNPKEGIYRNVIIGDVIQTDYSELRLKESPNGKWIGSRTGFENLLYTLAIVFSQALIEVLGKERGAVDFAITPTGRICIFDTNPGGAGYSNQIKDKAILKRVIEFSYKMLKVAQDKDASDILLDKFTIRHINRIDVRLALSWLEAAFSLSNV